MDETDPRAALDRLTSEHHDDYAGLSRLIGKNPAYIQQYIRRGTPKRLGEEERAKLARYFGVDESLLGAPQQSGKKMSSLHLVPLLAVGASAGAGSLSDVEALAGRIGFNKEWLKNLGCNPSELSLIGVVGDSMAPTLANGDDIMVDTGAATPPAS